MAFVPLYNHRKQPKDVKYEIRMFYRASHSLAKDRGRDQYMANISGGKNQLVEASRLVIISEGKTCPVGVHVTRPSLESSRNAPSIAVASLVQVSTRTDHYIYLVLVNL